MTTRPFGTILFTGYALLIGVEDYSAYDPARSLLAGRNDVLACWRLCRTLGYQIRQIRVLTTPALPLSELVAVEKQLDPGAKEADLETALADVVRAEATRSNITEGVTWLAEQLERLERPLGFLSYSGHGARLAGDLALCPSDLRRLEDALGFAEIRSLLDQSGAGAAQNLTVLLDCCFAGRAGDDDGGGALRPTSLDAKDGAAKTAKTEIGGRVFGASDREQRAYQARLGGRWHGAFTWAFTVALEQWKTVQEGHSRRSTIDHAELVSRARKLLQALSFPQTPVLVTEGIDELAVFDPEGVARAGETSDDPTAARPGVQLDPTGEHDYVHYQFWQDAMGGDPPDLLAEVIVTSPVRTAQSGFEMSKEYWRIAGDAFQSDSIAAMDLRKAPHSWTDTLPFTKDQASFSCDLDPSANRSTQWGAGANRADRLYQGSGFRADVSWDPISLAWSGSLEWVRSAGQDYVFQDVAASAALSAAGTPQPRGASVCTFDSSYMRTIGGPIVSDRNVILRDLTGSAYLAASTDKTDYAYWARWAGDAARAEAHVLTKISGGDTLLRDGDTVQIKTTDTKVGSEAYLADWPSHTNVVYDKNDSSAAVELWTIQRVGGGSTSAVLRTGDAVRFYNHNQEAYLFRDGDQYLSIRTEDPPLSTVWVVVFN